MAIADALPPVSFHVTLSGFDQVAYGSHVVTIGDLTGLGLGWRLTISTTQFVAGDAQRTLPPAALAVGWGSGASFVGPRLAPGTARRPDDAPDLSAPTSQLTIPAHHARGLAAPVTFLSAAPGRGHGLLDLEIPYSLFIPANTYAGTYTTAVTITQLAGP